MIYVQDAHSNYDSESNRSKLIQFFEDKVKPEGLGLKKLREEFWEIRTDLKDRILFRFKSGCVEFVLIGNHDEIQRLLRALRS